MKQKFSTSILDRSKILCVFINCQALLRDTDEDKISLLLAFGCDAETTPHSSESDRSLADLLSESSSVAGRTSGVVREKKSRGCLWFPVLSSLPACSQLTCFHTCGVQAQPPPTSLTLPPTVTQGTCITVGGSHQRRSLRGSCDAELAGPGRGLAVVGDRVSGWGWRRGRRLSLVLFTFVSFSLIRSLAVAALPRWELQARLRTVRLLQDFEDPLDLRGPRRR